MISNLLLNPMCNNTAECDRMSKAIGKFAYDYQSKIDHYLSLISNKEGIYKAVISGLSGDVEAMASFYLLHENNLKKFKVFAHISSKLRILAGWTSYMNEDPSLYKMGSGGFNVGAPIFSLIMSDSTMLKRYYIRNINSICQNRNVFSSISEMTNHMRYNTLLMLEGSRLNELKVRSELFLSDVPKFGKKRIPDYEFFLAFANQDPTAMRKALEPLFKPGQARIAAREVAALFDFYLQPQLVVYTKLASMHGYDLQIDLEIAPKALTDYDPLSEEEYFESEFEFMKKYDLDFPYEYQQIWLDYYLKKRDDMVFPDL